MIGMVGFFLCRLKIDFKVRFQKVIQAIRLFSPSTPLRGRNFVEISCVI